MGLLTQPNHPTFTCQTLFGIVLSTSLFVHSRPWAGASSSSAGLVRLGSGAASWLTTGYIGSTVLDRILKADRDAKITVYGRRPEVLQGFAKVDARLAPAEGSLSDLDKLEQLAAEHDITINCADADGYDANAAILRGLKKRHESGKTPILLHTSGTGTLSDLDAGTFATKDIYTDLEKAGEFKPLASLPDKAFHREVDLSIVKADREGYVKAYIVLPSTIYGISETPFADAGLANPQSQQVPLLIRISLDRKAPAMIGEGKNLWPDVHIGDCAVRIPFRLISVPDGQKLPAPVLKH